MSSSPLVTIGLPVYNSERHVEQSLNSLLAQTYADFRLVISDNASTDDTSEICRDYASRDSRIEYLRNEVNIGNPRNFNRVFSLTQTPYLKWSTADDLWAPTFLEKAMAVVESDPSIILCYPKTYIIDAEGKITGTYEDNLHLIQDNPVERFLGLLERISLAHQHLGVIRMSMLRRTHLLRTHVSSDINLLAEMTLYGKFYELDERLFYRRFHERSGSWKRGDLKHDAERYKAAGESHLDFRRWKGVIGHFSSVNCSPLPIGSKLRLNRYLMRGARWARNELLAELKRNARAALPFGGSQGTIQN